MWLATTSGFFSATSAGNGRVQVRARARRDLERLKALTACRARILRTPDRDYPYRIYVTAAQWTKIAAKLASAVGGYSNFKARVGAVDKGRADLYHRVWEVFADIELEEAMADGRTVGEGDTWR